jgi:hypothetical protein
MDEAAVPAACPMSRRTAGKHGQRSKRRLGRDLEGQPVGEPPPAIDRQFLNRASPEGIEPGRFATGFVARHVAPWSLAADAVSVAVEVVDVAAGDADGSVHVGGPVTSAVGAVDVAGDGHAGAAVVRVAPLAGRRALL